MYQPPSAPARWSRTLPPPPEAALRYGTDCGLKDSHFYMALHCLFVGLRQRKSRQDLREAAGMTASWALIRPWHCCVFQQMARQTILSVVQIIRANQTANRPPQRPPCTVTAIPNSSSPNVPGSKQASLAHRARKFCDIINHFCRPRGGFLVMASQFGTSTNVSLNIFCGESRALPNCTLPMVVTTMLIRPPVRSTLGLSWIFSGAP